MTEQRSLTTTGHLSITELNELAWAIDADGLARHQDRADEVVGQARSLGLSTPLVDVLADRQVPMPVRERAFGKVVNALSHAAVAASPDWALAN